MLTPTQADKLSESFTVFSEIGDSALQRVVSNATFAALPTASVAFDVFMPCDAFILPVKGTVKVVQTSEEGRELVLYRVDAGDTCMLTTSCIIGNTNYPARGIVESDAEVVLLPTQLFRYLMYEKPPFAEFVFQVFSRRIVQLASVVHEVCFQKLDRRLAALLLQRAEPITATHQELAADLGSVREIVSRILATFRDSGLIKIERRRITITDHQQLRAIAENGGR